MWSYDDVLPSVDVFLVRLPDHPAEGALAALIDDLDEDARAQRYEDLERSVKASIEEVLSDTYEIPPHHRAILRLALSTLPLEAALGQLRPPKTTSASACATLLWRDEPDNPDQLVPAWPQALVSDNTDQESLAVRVVLRWLGAFFVGEARGEETAYASAVRGWAESWIERLLMHSDCVAPSPFLLDASFALCTWSMRHGLGAADEVLFHLQVAATDAQVDPRLRAQIVRFLADPMRDRVSWLVPDPRATAMPGPMPAGEREAITRISVDPAAWVDFVDELLRAADTIADHRLDLREAETQQAFDAGALRTLVAAAAALAEAGDVQRAIELLSRVHGVEPKDRLEHPVIMVATDASAVWAAPDGTSTPLRRPHELRACLEALDRALRREGPTDSLTGTFDRDAADELWRRSVWYLQPTRLEGVVGGPHPRPRPSIVPLPWLELPLQAVSMRHRGWTAPISLTLREPATDRDIKRVVVWTYGLYTDQYEMEALHAAFAGRAEVVPVADRTPEALHAVWQDPHVDLIWFSVHGTLDPTEAQVGLELGPDFHASAELFQNLEHPAGARRLIVLNACDSGATLSAGGTAGLGLATAVASPSQAVITHLWPAGGLPAAAFGALLADGLASNSGFFDAFERALCGIMDPALGLADRVEQAGAEALARRIRPSPVASADAPAWNLAEWGSPAFFT